MISELFSRHRVLLRRMILLIAATLVLLVICDVSWARAGGGGAFSDGSSGGFGGSGGSSGDGVDLFFLIMLIIHYPWIGVPLVIIIVVFSLIGGKHGRSYQVTRTIRNYNQKQEINTLNNAVSKIQTRDPDFSKDKFKQQASSAFLRIQAAWSNQDMKSVRHFVSDGIFERFSLQLKMMKECGIENSLSNVNILDLQIVSVDSDSIFDAINIKISASGKESNINLTNGKLLDGSDSDSVFAEYWTFLRRPGAKTISGKALMDDCCPNCGTPLEITDSVECPSCHAFINSGDYDWVLVEITQESEWSYKSTREIPGMSELLAKDPTFNINHIEDRVSVIFFRWIAAQMFADPRYIGKLAINDFMEESADRFRPLENGKRRFYADAAVGSVDTIEIISAGDADRIRVSVRWSAHREEYKLPGLIKPDYSKSRIYTHEFILMRQSSAVSSDKNVLSSIHCPNCGAPETLSDKAYCEYCQTPLNDGSRDWVLENIDIFNGPRLTSSVKEDIPADMYSGINFMNDGDALSLIACAASMMLADGDVDKRERKLLDKYAALRSVGQEQLEQLLASVREGTMNVTLPEDRNTALYFIRCLTLMCLADGKVTKEEREFLHRVADHAGIPVDEADDVISAERKKLYNIARGRNAQ
jgi:uncharacterized Zn finger protein (UPF0148 family)/uncharacterized tellurite resistance protein B-like protein